MSETDLVRACMQYLELRGVFCYRQNSGAISSEYKGRRRFHRFASINGLPDIVAIIDGKYTGFECKVGKGRQSPNQAETQQKIESAGGKYFLVRTLDDVAAALDMI